MRPLALPSTDARADSVGAPDHRSEPHVDAHVSPDAFADYMRMLSGRMDLLTGTEVEDLSKSIEAGQLAAECLESGRRPAGASAEELTEIVKLGRLATERFLMGNMRLALALARPHISRLLPSQSLDVVQAATIGLLTAIEKYDYRRGFKFSTYATWWIKSAIDNELLALREITVSRRTALELRQIAKMESEWIELTGEEARPADLAAELDLSEARVRFAKGLAVPAVRLNQRIDAGGQTELGDLIAAEDTAGLDRNLVIRDRRRTVDSALAQLNPAERDVIRRRFGFDGPTESQRAVALARGESFRTARTLEASAMQKLRDLTRELHLSDLIPEG